MASSTMMLSYLLSIMCLAWGRDATTSWNTSFLFDKLYYLSFRRASNFFSTSDADSMRDDTSLLGMELSLESEKYRYPTLFSFHFWARTADYCDRKNNLMSELVTVFGSLLCYFAGRCDRKYPCWIPLTFFSESKTMQKLNLKMWNQFFFKFTA